MVNVAGSLLLGLLAAAAPRASWRSAASGSAGALTTFSTFSFETVRLLETGRPLTAVANVAASVAVSVAAAAARVVARRRLTRLSGRRPAAP